MPDFSEMDRSPLLGYLFYPRRDFTPSPAGAFDLLAPVEEGIAISCRFYGRDPEWPWILYFHGNGEVVSDYDPIAPLYQQKRINLVVADYRGYGASGGTPNFTHLIHDAPIIFQAVREELPRRGFSGRLSIMGRSLGSISALEIAYHDPDLIQGMILESGFASITRLILHLGLPAGGIHLENIEREYLSRIGQILVPALIIHGEYDSLVPRSEARDLFDRLGSGKKELVIIPQADHNNLLWIGGERYMEAIERFLSDS